MRIILIVFFILALGALFIISENNLYLSNISALERFTEIYTNWLDGVFSNIKNTTGYAINLNWSP